MGHARGLVRPPRQDRLHAEFKRPSTPRATPSVRTHRQRPGPRQPCRPSTSCAEVDGRPRFVSDPPLIVPLEELVRPASSRGGRRIAREPAADLPADASRADRRHLLDNYEFVHIARKVVGVGSVGTGAWIVLLLDRDDTDPLILQVKEARPRCSSASPQEPSSNHGERVVTGQRLMQAASDIFLGWDRVGNRRGARDFYVRQLRDWKGSADMGDIIPVGPQSTARSAAGPWPGPTPARGTGSPSPPTSAAARCSPRPSPPSPSSTRTRADRDFEALKEAVASGRVTAETGI